MGDVGELQPPPYALAYNPQTLLRYSDLVFIDPVSTGFSRAVKGEKSKDFHGYGTDIESVGEVIRLWTTRNGRWMSPKYLCGESYGTTRAAVLVSIGGCGRLGTRGCRPDASHPIGILRIVDREEPVSDRNGAGIAEILVRQVLADGDRLSGFPRRAAVMRQDRADREGRLAVAVRAKQSAVAKQKEVRGIAVDIRRNRRRP